MVTNKDELTSVTVKLTKKLLFKFKKKQLAIEETTGIKPTQESLLNKWIKQWVSEKEEK